MELENEIKEEEKNNISDEETDLELLQKFSKHKNNLNKKNNKDNIFIKCSFDSNTIEQNKKILSKYENSGLIKTAHYFSLDKDELEDPIDPKKIRQEKNNFYLFEKDVENSDLYCGYIDHMNLQKIKNQEKAIVSCPYCFCLISNNILENKTELGYIIIGKSKYIFKDFSSGVIKTEKAQKFFKDNKGIKNYEKEKKKELIKNEEEKKSSENNSINEKMDLEGNDIIEQDDIENKYVIISCINCGNIIGLCDANNNTKIILDYL
jgi:hypothetical protein